MSTPAIALVDTGTGNLASVALALAAAGASGVEITAEPERIRRADRVVFPGQGAFRDGAAALARDGGALGGALREALARGAPFLGVCLGLQVLFEASEEAPGASGLGYFKGRVQRFPANARDADGTRLKVPHIGWNRVEPVPTHASATARAALGTGDWYYFVHSYVAVPDDPALIAAQASHGAPFAAAVGRDHVLAVQFHPEKSQRAGLALLTRWLAL